MNNSKERTGLNRMKRFFCLMVVVMLAVSMLPVTGLAVGESIVWTNSKGLEVTGTPNPDKLPVGSGYRIDAIERSSSWWLELTNNEKTNIATIKVAPNIRSVTWNEVGLKVTLTTPDDSWQTGLFYQFSVVDDDTSNSNTTIATAVLKPGTLNRTSINRRNRIQPVFTVIDDNIAAEDVDSNVKPILLGPSGAFNKYDKEEIITKDVEQVGGNYTIEVKLPLEYTGTGKDVFFKVKYQTKDGIARYIDCTATIPYTVEYVEDDDDDDDDDPADTLIPYIIVDSYAYGGTSVTAGEEFTLTLRLRNTSSTHSLENIVMNVSPMGVFSMTSSSNTFYINKLQAGSILERTVTLKAGLTKVTDDEDANSIDMKFTYQYLGKDDKTLQTGNSSESITLPVDFPDRFELGIPESDDMAFAGEDFYLSVPMVNKGRSSVYNLTAFVRGDGLKNPGQTQYIGNLNAGTGSSADFSLQYLAPGEYSGEIVVTYEDANMNPKEMVAAFNVSVEDMWSGEPMEPEWPDGFDPNIPAEPTDAVPEEDPVRPVKIAVALVVCAMSAYVTIQKAKAKRSIYLDEDL